jgi:hypothetical protein
MNMAKTPSKASKTAAPQPEAGTQEGQQPEAGAEGQAPETDTQEGTEGQAPEGQAEGAEQDQSESAQAGSDETTDTEPQAGPEAGSETPEADPEVATEEVKTVTVTAPRGFQLRLDDHTVLTVKPGVQEMPEHLATHWYAVANGVTIYNPEA